MRQALFRTYVQGESLLDKAYLSESETESVLFKKLTATARPQKCPIYLAGNQKLRGFCYNRASEALSVI